MPGLTTVPGGGRPRCSFPVRWFSRWQLLEMGVLLLHLTVNISRGKDNNMKNGMIVKTSIASLVLGACLALPAPSSGAEAKTETIKGEVVDLMCYLDHGAKGEKHKGCATKCIESGGPVGLLTADNQLYLVIGEHKPINTELAAKAAETVTLKGKVVERNGMKMIENAELQP
jgi:hypothetical protein